MWAGPVQEDFQTVTVDSGGEFIGVDRLGQPALRKTQKCTKIYFCCQFFQWNITKGSLLIANGADVATVAGLLGHSQPSTTLDIYTHAFDKNKKAASEALQRGLDI